MSKESKPYFRSGSESSSGTAERRESEKGPSHYVGIGASAGGLEAIEAFFKNMPEDSGMCFIVVQHLSPDYKSLMVELLSKRTRMRVNRAEEGVVAVADEVYLIPPKKNLRIFHGKLLLDDQDFSRGINLPIDVFLRSLAEDQGEKAVGIILSGTGSDGMRGIRSVKESGGMVMVQDEESAKFDGMPRSAISTGLADFILPPDGMPEQLLAYAKHPYVTKAERSDTILTDEDRLARIFSLLRDKTKVDFTYYKPSTVVRRIERRMTVNQVHDLRDYVRFMESNQGEIHTLYRELLIGVTSFFRDRRAFQKLDEIHLPRLFEKRHVRELRFWVTGCSTGEEAYTVAILSRECLDRLNRNIDIKIFATDIDRDAIVRAGAGVYPESIAADLSPELLSKYFFKKDDNFQISRSIREMVVFAQHNLIKDPPFTNIDLISCRNLLIYLQPVLQKKVLEQFNFSLNQDGLLLLGTSETTGDMSNFFEALDHRWKIYRCRGKRKPASAPHEIATPHYFDGSRHYRKPVFGRGDIYRQHEEERVLNRFLQSLSPDYIPLALIVNEDMEVLHLFGNSEGYFRLPAGKIVNNISKMAAKDLAIPLNTGIQKVFTKNEAVAFSNVNVMIGNEPKKIRLQIKPLPTKKNQNPLAAVLISEIETKNHEREAATDSYDYDIDHEAQQRILDLEQELQFTRENLQATIEELETSNEELQATNEELLASNEELQSTNEELQSVNEELYTVNAEYQSKIMELTELNNDMDNLLSSTRIGTLFLDEYLEIRKYTPGVARIFKIMDNDIGRPIGHLSHSLVDADPVAIIESVQKDHRPVEKEILTGHGDWYLMRALPYFLSPDVVSGVVVTFVEINSLKSSREALKKERDLVAKIMETSPVGITMVSSEGRISFANTQAEKILGIARQEIAERTYNAPGWRITDLEGEPFPEEKLPFRQVLDTGKPVFNVRHAVEKPDGQTAYLSINSAPLFDERGRIDGMVSTIENLTAEYSARRQLEKSERSYKELFDNIHFGVVFYEPVDGGRDFVMTDVNREVERIERIGREQIVGKKVGDVFPGVREFGLLDVLKRVNEKGGHEVLPVSRYRDHRTDGWRKNYVYKVAKDRLVVVYSDETKAVQREKACIINEKNIRSFIDNWEGPAVLLDLEGRVVSANQAAGKAFGRNREDLAGRDIFALLDGDKASLRRRQLESAIAERAPKILAVPEDNTRPPEFFFPIVDFEGNVESVAWAGGSAEP